MDINTTITSSMTLLVGLFVFIIYRFEKNDKEKTAASIILEEIREIEKEIDKLKDKGYIRGVPVNLSTKSWFSYRYIFVKYLNIYELSQIELFFVRTELLNELLKERKNLFAHTMKVKASIVQESLAKFAIEDKDNEEKVKRLHEKFEAGHYWFEPTIYQDETKSLLSLYSSISTTTIGNKLIKISKKSWFSNKV